MFKAPMALDSIVSETFSCHGKARENQDAFGLEIELEGLNVRTSNRDVNNYWTTHEDGSLRAQIPGRDNGMGQTVEYVSRGPLSLTEAIISLKFLFDYLNLNPKVKVFPSYRTSIHVHVNCAMETWRTVYNFITLCIILDELLAYPNGDHRVGNNFCLRFVDAEAVIADLCDSMSSYGNINELPSNMRYSAINFASLRKFGTIEFRSLECTTDLDRVAQWIGVCQRVKEVSREFQTPIDIIGLFSKYNEEEFLSRVLGIFAPVYAKVPGYKLMLKRGMRIAQDFAYSSQWVAAEKPKESLGDILKKATKKPIGFNIDPAHTTQDQWVEYIAQAGNVDPTTVPADDEDDDDFVFADEEEEDF